MTSSNPFPASPVLEVCNLSKRFDKVIALDGLSFTMHGGEILGLLGPNGAGKTTTINLLLGLTTPTSGDISILGLPLEEHRLEILARVNFSSAYVALPSNLTALENLTVFAYLYGVRKPRQKIMGLLDFFGIAETALRVTGSLSSGQLTRLNLCKALLNDPEILFLDEPTASLDPDIADKVRAKLMELRKERRVTMIYTSHNMDEVEEMCDRVIFISKGRLIMQGPPRKIVAEAKAHSLEDLFISIARNGHLYDFSDNGGDAPCGSG